MAEEVLQFRFARNDIHATETTSRGCLRLLSGGKKSGRQKVVVGDQTGITTVFGVGKHHDVKVEFQTIKMNKPVTAIDVYCDQIFVGSGGRINAYTKKGKPFFGLETNLSETIQVLRIDTPFLFTGGDYVLTQFRESTEMGFFLCPDRINQLAMTRSDQEGVFDVFLACQDRMLRTVRNTTKSNELGVESPLMSLQLMDAPETAHRELLYGTFAGSMGCFNVTPSNELVRKYSVIPEKRLGSITGINAGDVVGDGASAILLGRDDGFIEVHSVTMNPDGTPVPIWQANIGECVNSVECGMVTNVNYNEVVVSSFSGKIITFLVSEEEVSAAAPVVPAALTGPQAPLPTTDQPAGAKVNALLPKAIPPSSDPEAAPLTEVLQKKVIDTTADINRLKEVLKLRKVDFAKSTNAPVVSPGVVNESSLRAIASQFHVRDKFVLDESAAIVLQIEADTPLDTIALQANVDLDLLDNTSEHASNIVVSTTKPGPLNKETRMLAVVRCADPNTRTVSLRLRSFEGQYGPLRAFVTAAMTPRTSQLRTYTIRPLSLHHRVTEKDVDTATLPLSVLRIQGSFSAKDAHAWVFQCLPEVPEVFTGEEGKLYFANTFLHTVLVAKYRRGEAEFSSENLSSLAILKECVTKEATARKIQVRMNSELNPESVSRMLGLLHPLLQRQSQLVQQLKLVEALREIESQEQNAQFLCAEYKEILENSREIETEITLQPKRMEYLKGLLTRLLFDRALFIGESVNPARTQQLHHILEKYEEKPLRDFFATQ